MTTRGIFNISMCDSVYQRLGDEPNSERTWGLLREVIGYYLFRSDFVPVPFIGSAAYYNQLFVFAKQPSVSIKILNVDNKRTLKNDICTCNTWKKSIVIL